MVPCLHQSNAYIKRKLRNGELKNAIALSVQKNVQAVAGMQSTRFHSAPNIGPTMYIWGNSGLLISMVPCLHQSNDYIKRKLQVWRA